MNDQPGELFCPSGHVLTGPEILSLYRRYKSLTKIGRPSGLSDADVLSIKKRILVKEEQATALAEELHISLPYISLIVKGKRKAWVKLSESLSYGELQIICRREGLSLKGDIAVLRERVKEALNENGYEGSTAE